MSDSADRYGMFFDAQLVDDEYDRIYTSSDFASYLDQIVGNGIFPNPSTQMQVYSAGSPLAIRVAEGDAWIKGHKYHTDEFIWNLDDADPLLDRIDRIIVYMDIDNRRMGIAQLKGTPAVSPVGKALTRTNKRWELCVAEVRIPKNATAMKQEYITDTRANTNLCGWVTGLIQQVDTATLFLQWQAAYQAYYADIKDQLDEFMQTLTEELNVETFVVNFKKDVYISYSGSLDVALDMNGYTYDDTDIIFVFINGLLGIQGSDYSLNTSVTPPIVHVNITQQTGVTNTVSVRVLKTRIGIAKLVDALGNHLVTNNNDNIISG